MPRKHISLILGENLDQNGIFSWIFYITNDVVFFISLALKDFTKLMHGHWTHIIVLAVSTTYECCICYFYHVI